MGCLLTGRKNILKTLMTKEGDRVLQKQCLFCFSQMCIHPDPEVLIFHSVLGSLSLLLSKGSQAIMCVYS